MLCMSVCFLSHVNRKTQFENPVLAQRRQSHTNSMSSYSFAPPPHQGPPSFQSAAALAKAQEAEAQSRSVFDQHIISHYYINTCSDRKVARIKKLINKGRKYNPAITLIKTPLLTPKIIKPISLLITVVRRQGG